MILSLTLFITDRYVVLYVCGCSSTLLQAKRSNDKEKIIYQKYIKMKEKTKPLRLSHKGVYVSGVQMFNS
jgi:hypothetical protein